MLLEESPITPSRKLPGALEPDSTDPAEIFRAGATSSGKSSAGLAVVVYKSVSLIAQTTVMNAIINL